MNSEKQSTNLQMTLREVNRVGEGKKNIPKLRFKGYEDAWEQRKLGEVGTTYTGLSGKTKEDFGHGNGQFITYMNVFSNAVASSEMVEPVEIDDRQNKVVAGDVLFTTSSETPEEVGMSSVWLENSKNTYLNSFCFGYRPIIPFDPYYLAFMLRSSLMRKKITFLAQGISRYNISKNKMMDIEIPVPIMSEQHQIGEYFRNLDYLITLHQRKYDALKTMKKTLLSKMFPKDGEDVPEIRFKGFTDAWEQRKLGEEVQIVMGQSPKGENYTDNPKDYILVQGNADMKDGKVFPRVWTTQVTKQAYKGDIILSVRAPVGDIGKTDYDVVIGRGVAAVKGNEFFYQLLGKLKQDGYWTKSSTGSTFDSINSNEIKNAKVTIPDIKEQLLIGDYFQGIDNLITLHQRKLDELKNMKKTLLQQMFV